MRHVHHEDRVDLLRHLGNPLEVHDPRVRDPQYVQSIVAEENAGFFVEQTRDLIIDERLNAIEAALASLTDGKKLAAAPLVDAVKKLRELHDDPADTPGREVRGKGKVVPLAKREKQRPPLSDAEKAEKDALLQEALGN